MELFWNRLSRSKAPRSCARTGGVGQHTSRILSGLRFELACKIDGQGRSTLSCRTYAARRCELDNGNSGDQRAATAFAATFLFHSARKTFISARNVAMRGPTPLYFFVIPVDRLPSALKNHPRSITYHKRLMIDGCCGDGFKSGGQTINRDHEKI